MKNETSHDLNVVINDIRDIQLTLTRLSPEIKKLSKKTYTSNSVDRILEMLHIIRLDLGDE